MSHTKEGLIAKKKNLVNTPSNSKSYFQSTSFYSILLVCTQKHACLPVVATGQSMTSIRSGDASFANVGSASATSATPSGSGVLTSPTRRTAAAAAQPPTHLDDLLFKATRPSNKLEDVNTIKQFCDAVNTTPGEGAVVACRLLAHKIQSPQEREAVQALAVLEACVKSCGPSFHAEVGKFKFLNEMIKLVSPR